MRTGTFILSFVVHAVLIGAAIAVRIFAPTWLPDPPGSTSYMVVAAAAPSDVHPLPARTPATASDEHPNAVPIEDSIAPDSSDIPIAAPSDGGLGQIVGEILGAGPPAPPGPGTDDALPPQRVGGLIRPALKIHHVPPVYPELARDSLTTGTVILEALIAEDGSVREVKVLKSIPLLDGSALDAVRQWRFTPTLLNGVPVQIIMSVTVTFTLK